MGDSGGERGPFAGGGGEAEREGEGEGEGEGEASDGAGLSERAYWNGLGAHS